MSNEKRLQSLLYSLGKGSKGTWGSVLQTFKCSNICENTDFVRPVIWLKINLNSVTIPKSKNLESALSGFEKMDNFDPKYRCSNRCFGNIRKILMKIGLTSEFGGPETRVFYEAI